MVQKALIKDWMKEEFAQGKYDNIPANILEILKGQAQQPAAPVHHDDEEHHDEESH